MREIVVIPPKQEECRLLPCFYGQSGTGGIAAGTNCVLLLIAQAESEAKSENIKFSRNMALKRRYRNFMIEFVMAMHRMKITERLLLYQLDEEVYKKYLKEITIGADVVVTAKPFNDNELLKLRGIEELWIYFIRFAIDCRGWVIEI